MKSTAFHSSALIVCAVLIVVLFFRVLSLESQVRATGDSRGGLAPFQVSLKQV